MRTYIWNCVKVVLGNVLILAALFVAAEILYRAYHFPSEMLPIRTFPGDGAQQVAKQVSWARPDPELGWVFSGKNYNTFANLHYFGAWKASVNREGFRAKSDYDAVGPKGSVKRLMVLGDSFTFGMYINDSETLTSFLQKKLGNGYEVYNFAIPGWGIDQMYLAYKEYVGKINPDYVVVVYIDRDILRAFESYRRGEGTKPSFEVVKGHLESRAGTKLGVLDWMAKNSLIINKFYNRLFKRYECLDIAESIFSNLSHETIRRGEHMMVVRYPTKDEVRTGQENMTFDLKGFFASNGIKYFDPEKSMRSAYVGIHDAGKLPDNFYLKFDPHPAREGNEFIASYILKVMSKLGWGT
jgi:hypothetical protein